MPKDWREHAYWGTSMRWTRIWQPFCANLSIYWFYWFFALLGQGLTRTCLLGYLNALNTNMITICANLSIYWFYWFSALLDQGLARTCLLGYLNALNTNMTIILRQFIDLLILSIFPHFRSRTDKDMSSWVFQYAEYEYDKHFAWNIDFSILLIFGSSAQWSDEDISPGVPRYAEYEYDNHFVWIRRFNVTKISLLTFRPQVDGKRHLGFANMLITKIMEILMNLSMIVIGLSSMM